MERKSPRIRKLKMDRIPVERPADNKPTLNRQNGRKNSLPKMNSSMRGDHRQVTAGGDTGKMPRGYRARKSVQNNGVIGQPSPEETKLEMEKIKRTLVQKPQLKSNIVSMKSPIKPRSYDRVEDPKPREASRQKPEPKTTKTFTNPKMKTEMQSDRKPKEKPNQKVIEKVVQQPVKNSNSGRNRRKMQSKQTIDKSSKSEVPVPKPEVNSNSSPNRSPTKNQTKITNRPKIDPKMTKPKTTTDKKIAKKVEKLTNEKTEMMNIDITKIDQSLAKNKRTNKKSRREVFDETKNPEQTMRTLMYEERFLIPDHTIAAYDSQHTYHRSHIYG